MKDCFTLISNQGMVSLRTITALDCENLRQWKNDHRTSFFFQGIISPQMQEQWFQGYLERTNDSMFVVQENGEAIGCMAYRLIDGGADIYNVILGKPEFGGKGLMGKAMQLMCSYIIASSAQPIGLKVLQSNPAVNWYLNNGFMKVSEQENYFELQLDYDRFKSCEFQKIVSSASA